MYILRKTYSLPESCLKSSDNVTSYANKFIQIHQRSTNVPFELHSDIRKQPYDSLTINMLATRVGKKCTVLKDGKKHVNIPTVEEFYNLDLI